MMSKSKSLTRRIEREQSKLEAIHLKKQGISIREIAGRIGRSKSATHRLIQSALRQSVACREQVAEQIIELELLRLDDPIQAVWPLIQEGDLTAVDRLLKILERRAKLLGLDAPRKVAPTNPAGDNPYEHLTDKQLIDRIKFVADIS